ncbi:hypothetical protein PBY51_022852 [Eleginops maclovinus]|uniref:Uncharacterized protein n=1 Tax=Eleginops maclovinus TaxID=56733 RepID=A0AAN7XIB8_ELEMC|nr:hypothetical protein PBY51_022852 [Eleginops maclovinus]
MYGAVNEESSSLPNGTGTPGLNVLTGAGALGGRHIGKAISIHHCLLLSDRLRAVTDEGGTIRGGQNSTVWQKKEAWEGRG